MKYEGRSIYKLQKTVIRLIFKVLKFRNIHLVGDLILSTSCEFYYDDVTVTSFVNIRYDSIAAEITPYGTVFFLIRFIRVKGPSANVIQSEMHPVYGDDCFGVKSLLMVEKVLLTRNDLVAVLFRRPTQRSQQSILSCALR